MKKILIVLSIVTVVIIVVASFPSVVGNETSKSKIFKSFRTSDAIRYIKNHISGEEWFPGYFIMMLLWIILLILLSIAFP